MPAIVYFTLPAQGHLTPSLPLVAELAARGVRIHCLSTVRFREAIERAGAEFHPYSSRFRMPESGAGPFAQLDTTIERLLELTRVVLEDHLEEARALAPVCVLHDSFAPWGAFVAKRIEAPEVASVPSIALNEQIAKGGLDDAAGRVIGERAPGWFAALGQIGREFGAAIANPFALMHAYGDLNIVYTSRAFQPMAGAFPEERFRFVGPLTAERHEEAALPIDATDGRPLLLVSLGTVYNDRAAFFEACVEAFAGRPWLVAMATGGSGNSGRAPENFIARDSLPQIALLRRARVFVTHGGMNSVNEALWHGVPMVVAPQGGDQFWIARRVEELGAGISLAGRTPDAVALREAVERVAANPRYRRAAAAIGETLRQAGGAARAADEMEAFLFSLHV